MYNKVSTKYSQNTADLGALQISVEILTETTG